MIRRLAIVLSVAAVVTGGLAAIGFVLAPLLFPPPPNLYRTSVFAFNAPEGWACSLDGTEHVCLPENERPARGIIIIAVKFRAPGSDALQEYEDHLSTAVAGEDRDGVEFHSTIDYARRSSYGGRTWVDARHLGSELPGYFTRYLATVTSHVGVLVTFSAKQEYFEEFMPAFEDAAASLQIYQSSNN